jgi:rsbT co-antagonist protein RsbR
VTVALQDFFVRCPAMFFIADGDGALVQLSAALRERFATRLHDPPTLAGLAAAPDRERINGFLGALAQTDQPVACSFRVPDEVGGHTHLRCEARRHADGPIHGWLEVVSQTRRIEHVLLHAIINTLDIAVWAIVPSGEFVFHDGKALATAGLERGQHLGKNVFDLYPSDRADAIHEALAGTDSHSIAEARGTHWETWYVALTDEPGTAELATRPGPQADVCAGISLDITAAVETERALRRQLETIVAQQHAIRELSTPVIAVWDHVLTVPLIGDLNGEWIDELTARLLDACGQSKARFAILDMTGVDDLDTSIVAYLLRLLGSLRLLGVEGRITGISPRVAMTMSALGIELGSFQTHRTLRDGLRACMLALGERSSSSQGDRGSAS